MRKEAGTWRALGCIVCGNQNPAKDGEMFHRQIIIMFAFIQLTHKCKHVYLYVKHSKSMPSGGAYRTLSESQCGYDLRGVSIFCVIVSLCLWV